MERTVSELVEFATAIMTLAEQFDRQALGLGRGP
jgi:hypothetical protein